MWNNDSLQRRRRMSSDTDMRLFVSADGGLAVAFTVVCQKKDKRHMWTGATDNSDTFLQQTDGSSTTGARV